MDIKERIEGDAIYLNWKGPFPKKVIFQRVEGNKIINEAIRVIHSSTPGKYRFGSETENRT